MRKGLRGLRPGNSLAKLLAERRGKRNRKQLPKYTLRRILEWADAFHKRTEKWPITKSGPILDAQGEIWLAVDIALRKGQRGLPGGTSLAQLLDRRRPVQNRLTVPRLSNRQVLKCRRFSHKNGELADRIQRQSLTGSFGNVGRHRYSTETRQPRASRWKLTVQASGKTPRDRAASTVSASHQFSALDASELIAVSNRRLGRCLITRQPRRCYCDFLFALAPCLRHNTQHGYLDSLSSIVRWTITRTPAAGRLAPMAR
jgi:hypothetical protein